MNRFRDVDVRGISKREIDRAVEGALQAPAFRRSRFRVGLASKLYKEVFFPFGLKKLLSQKSAIAPLYRSRSNLRPSGAGFFKFLKHGLPLPLVGLGWLFSIGMLTGCGGSSDNPTSAGSPAEKVSVELKEWSITPDKVALAAAGSVTFKAKNTGTVAHEMVILKTDLPAGAYVLFCNVEGHYQNGMRVAFTAGPVSPGKSALIAAAGGLGAPPTDPKRIYRL